jgi:hypothetical protein
MLIKCGALGQVEATSFNPGLLSGDLSGSMKRFGEVIQEIHRVREKHPDYSYLRTRAIGNLEVDGPNSNADAFPYEHFDDSRPGYGWKSFIGKKAFEEHQSFDLRNSIGDLLDAYLNAFDLGHYAKMGWRALNSDQRMEVLSSTNQMDGSIEVLMGIDRVRAPHIARMIDTGDVIPVSMGTNVQYSDCSVCGNRAFWEKDYCAHVLQKGRLFTAGTEDVRRMLKDGILRVEWLPWIVQDPREREIVLGTDRLGIVKVACFEINHELGFFELSVVGNAAYHRGRSLEKVASSRRVAIRLDELKSACDGEVFREITRPDGQVVAKMNDSQFAVRVHIGADRTNVVPISSQFLEFPEEGGQSMRRVGRKAPRLSSWKRSPLEITAVEVGGKRFVQEGSEEGVPTVGNGTKSSDAPTKTAKEVGELRDRLARLRRARLQDGKKRRAFTQAPGDSSKDTMEDYGITPPSDQAEIDYNADSAAGTRAQIDKEHGFDLALPEGRIGLQNAGVWAKQAMSRDRMPAKTAWIVYTGRKGDSRASTPRWILTFGTLNENAGGLPREAYRQFCSGAYGEELIRASRKYGLEATRRRVGGTLLPSRRVVSQRVRRGSRLHPPSRRIFAFRTPERILPRRSSVDRRADLYRRATPPSDAKEQRAYYSKIFPKDYVDALLASRRKDRVLLAKAMGQNKKMRTLLSRMIDSQQVKVAGDKAKMAEAIMVRIAQNRPGEFTRGEFASEVRRLAGMPMSALQTLGDFVERYGATETFPDLNDPASSEMESGVQTDGLRSVSDPDGVPVDVEDAPDDILQGQEGLGKMDMSSAASSRMRRFAGVVPQMMEATEDLQQGGGDFIQEVSGLFTTTPGQLARKGIHVEPHNAFR